MLLVYAFKTTQTTPRPEVMIGWTGSHPHVQRHPGLDTQVVRGFTCISAHFCYSFDAVFGYFLVKVATKWFKSCQLAIHLSSCSWFSILLSLGCCWGSAYSLYLISSVLRCCVCWEKACILTYCCCPKARKYSKHTHAGFQGACFSCYLQRDSCGSKDLQLPVYLCCILLSVLSLIFIFFKVWFCSLISLKCLFIFRQCTVL